MAEWGRYEVQRNGEQKHLRFSMRIAWTYRVFCLSCNKLVDDGALSPTRAITAHDVEAHRG